MRCDAKSDESDGLALCVRVRVRVLYYSAAVPVESRFQSRGGGCGRSGSSTSNAMRASDAGDAKGFVSTIARKRDETKRKRKREESEGWSVDGMDWIGCSR